MSSVNSYRDSYPQIRPPVHWYQPNPEPFPPLMGFDPSKFSSVQGPWPYSTNPYPTPCNGSGNYMNFPGYLHNSPPPHPSLYYQQPCYYWGSHPGFFEPHPPCAGQATPASYMMDHPVFDGKSAGQLQHCCGCPNHVHLPKGGSNVKIEEHEPDLEQKAGYSSDGRNSMIPLNVKNYPYPIMWIPPNSMTNKDESQGRPSRKDLGDAYEEVKPAGKFSLEKPTLKEWFPLEMHRKHPFMAPHDLTREPSEQREDEGRNFEFPIFWVPSWDKQEEEGKEKSDPLSGSSKEAPFGDAADLSKNAQVQSVPPKDVNAHLAEKCLPGKKNVGDAADSNQEKAVKRAMNAQSVGRKQKQSSFPTKLSNLPPVCLRVDPFPKKTTNNEISSSVGHYESERKGKISSGNHQMEADTRNISELSMLPRDMNERNEGKQYEKKVKIIEVKSGDSSEAKDQKVAVAADFKKFDATEKDGEAGQNTDGDLTERELKINAAGDLSVEDSTEEKIPRRTFLDSEAATLIQAAYRGYETRRWRTLQKLKQMAGVRDGLIKIEESVEKLKSLNDSLCNANKFEKQRVVVGESIMSLLLQLDTIQGVHPSLRDVRKSLARKLVGLQEEIDSLVCKSSNAPKEEYEERRVEKSVSELNHTLVTDNAEAYDTVTSSIVKPPQLVQEEKHEESNELEQHLRTDTSPDAEHFHSGETGLDTHQNVDLRAVDVKVKEANDGLIGQQVMGFVVKSREDTGKQSSESAGYSHLNQCDRTEDMSIDIPSSRVAAAPQPAETVMLAEETNTPALSDPVELGADTCVCNNVESDESINTGENESEKIEDEVTKDADVTHDAEGGFCNQTTLKAHDEEIHMSSDAIQVNVTEQLSKKFILKDRSHLSEHAEAGEVEGENDSTLDASVGAPLSALPGVIMPGNQLHEERQEVVPSPQEDGNCAPLLMVPEHGVPENQPYKDEETIPSSQEEDGQVNIPLDNNNPSDTAEVGEQDKEASANLHPGHQPEGEAKPDQEEFWMKTSAYDCFQAAVMGKIEDNMEIIRSDPGEEQMLNEESSKNLSTSGCEYQDQGVKTSEDGDESVRLQEQPSAESANSIVGIPREVIVSSMNFMEENEKLREMMEKLMEVGKEQIDAIARLTERVRDLETKLAKSKKSRTSRCRTGVTLPRMGNAKSC